jgi:ATP-dependent Lhr-like helicase
MLAITSGGAIPEVADYRVMLQPEDTFIGTVNEDFAIESMAGDIFQLGNASWQILQVGSGVVRVADAKGAPPTIPFWLGEAPGRSDELSRAVSDLRAEFDRSESVSAVSGLSESAAEQITTYLADARAALGVLPTQDTLVLERFFDESGGMQLVLHAPFGSRVNRAWGLALRKRFCRQFNFELQAAATEDALLLSLGPQHSFPLSDVFRYLHPATAREVLIQAFLDAPVFQTRWRWNATISLAVPRNRHGRKVAPQLQRMQADDLMAAVFPDAAACLENIPGDRQIPDHPLVNQTVRDCLDEAMDFAGLTRVLERIHAGELRLVSRDTPEPSPLSHEILNARPYAFLDDAPLEERRAHAVQSRRASEPSRAEDLSALDPAAIDRVREEERPDPRDRDELHDVLLTAGFLTDEDAGRMPATLFDELARAKRCTRAAGIWIAAERLPEFLQIHPGTIVDPLISAPPSRASRTWTREEAIVELLRGRLSIVGPTTADALGDSLSVSAAAAEAALHTLEGEGAVLRGRFTPDAPPLEWCDRRLLARIHRYTLNRLRAEIEPVSPADFMRFLFAWHHIDGGPRLTSIDGLRSAIEKLDGFELAAAAWERAVLPARVDRYDSSWLDMLCLTGRVGWARLSTAPSSVISATPLALFLREHVDAWLAVSRPIEEAPASPDLTPVAQTVLGRLRDRGALFLHELAAPDPSIDSVREAIAELVSAGLVTSDGFAGVRALIQPRPETSPPAKARAREAATELAGRWSALRYDVAARTTAIEVLAWTLLARYGVVFRRLLTREAAHVSWRELVRVYRRLELRGDIRGGRFVSGMSGEQFASADAVARLREIRSTAPDGRLTVISAADPLNLAGLVTPGERVKAIGSTRVCYRDGIPLAAMEGDYIRQLAAIDPALAGPVANALAGRAVPPVISGYVGRAG